MKSTGNRNLRKILAGILGICFISTFLFMVFPQVSHASGQAALTVRGDGVEKEVQFTMDDLRALPQKTYTYSGYNHWPALRVLKDMKGPTLKSILDAAGLKSNATLLKFKPSGGKYVHVDFTVDQLLHESRYYFPAGENPGDVVEWPPKRSEDGKVPVETIIALDDSNGRVCFGQIAPNEPTGGDCVMIQELCNNGVLEVSTEALQKWEVPTADPAAGKVAPGTKVSLIKPEDVPDNVMMYYTLDGSEPTYGDYIFNISYPSFQPAFNAPIPVNKKLTIKAKTIGFGKLDSDTVTFEYDTDTVFSDIQSHWAQDDINYLVNKGVIKGTTDMKFKPDEKVTRAQFAEWLVTALDIQVNKDAAISFQDVDASSPYHDYIAAAVSAGLITGYSNSVFAPGDYITREQMAVLISRAMQLKSLISLADIDSGQVIGGFSDRGDMSAWAETGIAAVVGHGIIKGVNGQTFAPKAATTRAESAVMILRLYKLLH